MRVLWFSNCVLSDTVCSGSGSWLFGMKEIISSDVELYNISCSNVSKLFKRTADGLTEFIIPTYKLYEGIPSAKDISVIQDIVKEISPDIIHIWGMENYWSRLYQRGFISGCPVLLEIQGVLSSLCNVFYGGLFPKDIVTMYGLREVVRPWDRLDRQYKRNVERAKDEGQILKSFSYISTQSQWTRNQIKLQTLPNCRIFETLRPIREDFYNARKWNKGLNKAPVIYTSVSYNAPFKGLHILIRALALVVKKYPDAKLIIAGFDPGKPFYKDNGYNRYIKKMIRELDLINNVQFPGRLNAASIIDSLLNSDIFVNPSFVESYSAAAAEALYLGVPSVLSYAGAMPYFSDDTEVALYYSPMDFVDCASHIIELYEDEIKCNQLSQNAISKMENKCSREQVLATQMGIYNSIVYKI